MTGRRAGTALLAGALVGTALAGCGGGSGSGAPTQDGVATDDCAGERPGPTAVVGMATEDGTERWARTFGDLTNAVEVDGVLVLAAIDGEAVGVDPASGAALWCRPGTGPFDNTTDPAGTITAPAGSMVLTIGPGDVLTAFDARTGQDVWTTQTPPSVLAYPQVSGDQVRMVENVLDATFAGQPPDETMPVIATYDLASGRPVDGPAEVSTRDRPGVSEVSGEVQLHWTAGPEPYQITVQVTDASTGAERWSLTRHGVSSDLAGDVVVIVDQTGGTVDPGTAADILIGYSATDGTELWSQRMASAWASSTSAGGLVLWSGGSNLTAIDAHTGAIRWQVDHGSPGRGGSTPVPGRYSLVVPSADGTVLAGVITAEEPYRD